MWHGNLSSLNISLLRKDFVIVTCLNLLHRFKISFPPRGTIKLKQSHHWNMSQNFRPQSQNSLDPITDQFKQSWLEDLGKVTMKRGNDNFMIMRRMQWRRLVRNNSIFVLFILPHGAAETTRSKLNQPPEKARRKSALETFYITSYPRSIIP